MKRLLVLIAILSLLVVAGTIVSAEGQTLHGSKFGPTSRTAAIIAGGTGIVVLADGKKRAASFKRTII